MWKSVKSAMHTSKSADFSHVQISAPLDAPATSLSASSSGAPVGGADPPKKPSRMSFSGIAQKVSGSSNSNRSRSASPALDREPTRSAHSLFASEPAEVPSPPKPPKPQYLTQNSAPFNASHQGLNDAALAAQAAAASRQPEPRLGGYPPLPTDSVGVSNQGAGGSAAPRSVQGGGGGSLSGQGPPVVPSSAASAGSRSPSPGKQKASVSALHFATFL